MLIEVQLAVGCHSYASFTIIQTSSFSDIFIVAAKRTPFGTYGGKLKDYTGTDLAEIAARAAVQAAKISPENVDTIIFGNVMQSSKDAAYLARHVGIRIGLPQHVPALTINRLCGSGFQSIVNAAHVSVAVPCLILMVGFANINSF